MDKSAIIAFILLHMVCNSYVFERKPGKTKEEMKSFVRVVDGATWVNFALFLIMGIGALLQVLNVATPVSNLSTATTIFLYVGMMGVTAFFIADNIYRLMKLRVPVRVLSRS